MNKDAYSSLMYAGESLYIEPDDGNVPNIKYFYNIYNEENRNMLSQI